MAGKVRHLLNRNGNYYARVVVPKHLRKIVGKAELRVPLGSDPSKANKKLHGAVAEFQNVLAIAEGTAIASVQSKPQHMQSLLTPDELALRAYKELSDFDLECRDADHKYAWVGVDLDKAQRVQAGVAGSVSDVDLEKLTGDSMKRARRFGFVSAQFGTDEWRKFARALCVAEYEALQRLVERDEGDFSGKPSHPLLLEAMAKGPELPPISIMSLFLDYIEDKKALGKARESERRWLPVFKDLIAFLGHDDARKMTKANVVAWRKHCMETKAASTVSKVYLSALKSVLNWAVEADKLDENVARSVKQESARATRNRERGYTEEEAVELLQVSLSYTPKKNHSPATTESDVIASAKRWVPILLAFTGARVTEITQVRREDFRIEGSVYVVRLTPDAGTIKTTQYRDVPLHAQLIALGFWDFVETSDGPLFYLPSNGREPLKAARATSSRISEWANRNRLVPEGVSPSHGFRHHFKTRGREHAIPDRVLDAIQGHAGKTAGDDYGDVTITTKKRWVDMLPFYQIE